MVPSRAIEAISISMHVLFTYVDMEKLSTKAKYIRKLIELISHWFFFIFQVPILHDPDRECTTN